MSRIVWHGPHPDMVSGYARQARQWIPRLAALGHEVAISCYSGHYGAPTEWRGFPVYPASYNSKWSEDVVLANYQHFKADLCIRLLDIWPLNPSAWRDMRVACWAAVDCAPMSVGDRAVLEQDGSTPFAMSQFGKRQLEAAGFDPVHLVPHGIDTSVFCPGDRAAVRESMGIAPDAFVVGINARNSDGDPDRKAWHENLRALSVFVKRHPETVVLLHTMMLEPGGLLLPPYLGYLGLPGAQMMMRDDRMVISRPATVQFSPQYELLSGFITDEAMADWYRACDVYLGPSCGEGFGLPGVEAQACGTPVILANAHTGPELRGAGWLVDCEPRWNWKHQADWVRPQVRSIVRALEKSHEEQGRPVSARVRRNRAREFALRFDAAAVMPAWETMLGEFA